MAKKGSVKESLGALLETKRGTAPWNPPERMREDLDDFLRKNQAKPGNMRVGRRALAAWFAEQGIEVSHTCVERWVARRLSELGLTK